MSNSRQLAIYPRDILFFRDAKPIGGSESGTGANWPLPSTFHSAMMSALHDKWPELQEFEHRHTRNEKDKNRNSSFRFGGLKTSGPFPRRDGRTFLPFPADLSFDVNGDSDTASLIKMEKGSSDLPSFLEYVAANAVLPSKKEQPKWVDSETYEKYLKGETISSNSLEDEPLFFSETRPGIEINPESRSTEEGQLYQAAYLRLNEGVSMTAFAECETVTHSPNGRNEQDLMELFFDAENSRPFVFGGQRGVAGVECQRSSSALENLFKSKEPEASEDGRFLLKWTLISPAVFIKGWLPNWIDPNNGEVYLKPALPNKKCFRNRREWREKIRTLENIKAKLIAARINKPFAFSGWREHGGKQDASGAKATMLAVPAGGVYYFRAETAGDAAALTEQLTGRRRSDLMGEQGFGLGVCSFNVNIKKI